MKTAYVKHAEKHLADAKTALYHARRAEKEELSEMAASYSNQASRHRSAYVYRMEQARAIGWEE